MTAPDLDRWIRETLPEAYKYFTEAERRERNADERTRAIADAHREGWKLVARAVEGGLRAIADAVRDNRR